MPLVSCAEEDKSHSFFLSHRGHTVFEGGPRFHLLNRNLVFIIWFWHWTKCYNSTHMACFCLAWKPKAGVAYDSPQPLFSRFYITNHWDMVAVLFSSTASRRFERIMEVEVSRKVSTSLRSVITLPNCDLDSCSIHLKSSHTQRSCAAIDRMANAIQRRLKSSF